MIKIDYYLPSNRKNEEGTAYKPLPKSLLKSFSYLGTYKVPYDGSSIKIYVNFETDSVLYYRKYLWAGCIKNEQGEMVWAYMPGYSIISPFISILNDMGPVRTKQVLLNYLYNIEGPENISPLYDDIIDTLIKEVAAYER